MRILYIDDSAVDRRLFEGLGRAHGAEVDTAADGWQGLELALRTAYDAVLIDLVMPQLHGLDVIRALRAGPGPNQRAPCMVVTAEGGIEDECRASGADAVFEKPIRIEAILKAVAAAAPKGRA